MRHSPCISPFSRAVGIVTALIVVPFGTLPRALADQTWTAASGVNFVWNNAANWSGGVPLATDNVFLPFGIPNPGVLSNPQTILLNAGSVGNALSFKDNYTLSGGDLTLTTGGVRMDLGMMGTIASQVTGANGLVKTGGGALRLTNATNNYTGTTTINDGIVSISNGGALGADTSTIIVNGSATRGFGGGALLLEGGVNLSRGLSLQGLGPVPSTGAALISVGNNTIAGPVTNGAATVNTTVSSAGGRLTLGDVTLGGAAGTIFMTFGTANSLGAGSYAITGALASTASAQGTIGKTGAGTLLLTPSSASGYSGIFQVSAGSIRVTDTASLGTSSATNAIDLNGGLFELRTDSPAFSSAKRINLNNGSGATDLLLDRAPGGSGLNQTVTFANFDYDAAETMVINTRNGYGATFTAATAIGAGAGDTTLTNNGNGLVTYGGTVWGNTDGTSRTLTINGTGNTVLSGSVTASGASHHFVKGGTGTVTVNGAASTYTGNTSISGGTLIIGSLGAINKNSTTGSLLLGATTAGGTLNYTGGSDTLAKPISLISTTGSSAILNNGAGALTFTGNVGAGGAGAKTFYLGGTNTADNTMSSLILDNNTTNTTGVSKIGSGIWVLKEPDPAAFGSAGSVTIANPGTTATTTITLSSGTTAGLLVGQVLAGTTASTPPQITSIIDATHFTVGVGLTTTTAPAGTYTVNPIPATSSATAGGVWSGALTVASGTLKLVATNATSNIVQNTNPIVFNVDALNANQAAGGTLEFVGLSGSATTETLGALTPTAGAGTVKLTSGGAGAAANLVFGSLGATTAASSVNFNTTGGAGGLITLTGQAATTATTLPGTANFQGHLYINGADFAAVDGSANVITPVYGTTPGFVNAPAALTASSHNLLTGSFSSAAATITSLKTGSQTLTLSGNLTVNLGAILESGGTATIQSNSTTARTIVGSAAGVNIAIRVDGTSDVLNLGALNAPVNISSTTTAGLTKNGAGTLVINGVNAQSGTTTINEGTIRLGVNSARLSAANAALVIRQGATLDLNGQSSGVAIGAFDGAGTVTNSSATPATLIVGNATTGAGTFSGIIQDGNGVMNVSVTGTTGTPTWSGLNTYTGVTTIGTGLATTAKLVNVTTLANYGTASSIGRGVQTAVNDANNAASLVFGGLSTAGIAYTGTTSVSIDRLFTLAGNFAGAGGQIANNSANNSTLILNKTNVITFAAGLTNAQTLTLGGSSTGDNQINLQIVDNGALATGVTKIGAGLWILGNSSNNYTGQTQIGSTTTAGGVLQAADGTTLSASSPLVIGGTTGGGVFQTSGNFVRNITATPVNGTGTVTFNSALTTGAVGFAASDSKLVVSLGGLSPPAPLVWGSGGFMGVSGTSTGAFVLSSSTALSEVEVRNPIDLNGATRTIQVDDNTNTFADYATISGVISGTGGLTKTGAGTLQLFGDNTYAGVTAVTSASTLTVRSLGNSASPGLATSVGSSTDANLPANAITLGNAGITAGILQYVGPGETSDRMIRLNTTTGSTQIHADGSGPLILTNVLNDMAAGNKTLFLRGANTEGNMIKSILADNVAGTNTLGVTVDGAAVWILTGANTYTGTTNISGGALGVGSDTTPFGTGTVAHTSGSVFAFGGDRIIPNNYTTNNTTTAQAPSFIGDYSITLNGATWAHTNTTVSNTITNTIASGKTLTINSNITENAITAARTLTFNGTGDTILNGNITSSTTFGVNTTYSGTGSLTLGGTINPNGGSLTISSGTVKLGNSDVIPNGAGAGNVTISPAAGVTARFDLNGKNETINGITANSAGNIIIDNSSSSPSSLTFGDNNGAVTLGGGTGTFAISNTGTGALSITKTGTAAATIPALNTTLSYTGTTNVTGGALTIAAPVNGTTGLSVQGAGSLLALTGGMTTPSAITSVSVGDGSTLNLLDGAGRKLNLATLTLGSAAGANTSLNLNVGDLNVIGDGLNTDTLSLLASGALNLFAGNKITFNLTDSGLNPNSSYVLLDASLIGGGFTSGPLTLGDYVLGATPGGFTSISLSSSTNNQIIVSTGGLISGSSYWRGLTDTTWNGNANNWSLDKAGATPAVSIPGQGTSVVFQWDAATNAPVVTTLEQNFKINSLTIEPSTTPANTPSSVTIAPGVLATNRLEIAPQSSTDGILLSTGAPLGVAITAPLRVSAPQTWTTADFSSLSLTGGSTTISTNTVTVASTVGLAAGMQVAGPAIPTGAYITGIVDATHFTISANATQTGTGQTYSATSALTLAGGLSGTADFTKSGPGRVVLSGSGASYTGAAVSVTGGILELQNVTALGGVAATPNTGATVTIGSGGQFRYNSATAGTVANPLVLNGGALTTGGFTTAVTTLALTAINHTFSGNVSIPANSSVSLAELGTSTTLGHTVTMSGAFSGGGKLTVDSVPTVSSGNQITGTLVLSGSSPAWSGGMSLKRGTVDLRQPDSIGTGAVNVELGRFLFKGATNTTWNQFANGLTIDAGSGNAVVELQPDNQGTSGLFTTDITGLVTLGGGGATPLLRLYQADAFSRVVISGNIIMNTDGSIHNSGAAANQQTNVISGIISESGGARALTINGDTLWASTNYQVLRLDGANTFSGPLTVAAGTVEFSTVTNAGGAASNLGEGLSINLGGTLKFIGGTSQSTDRPITLTSTGTLNASGTGGAVMTYNGAVTGGAFGLVLDGTGAGILNGILSQTGTAVDITKNGTGSWDLNATNVIADDILANAGTLNVNVTQQTTDDFVITGGATPTIVNLNAANANQGDDFFIRSGALVNLGVNGALSNNATNGMDALNIGDTGTNGSTLDLKGSTGNAVNLAAIGVDNTIDGYIIDSVGGGNISSTGWTVRNGAASATLAGATLAKNGAGTFTLSGNNNYTGVTTVTEGTLLLDYATNNGSKISTTAGVVMGGAAADRTATLQFSSNSSASSTQAFTTLTVSQGSNNFIATSNGGQAMNVNFTTITRNAGGTIDFTLPAVGNISSTQALTNGALGYATVNNGAALVSKDASNNFIPLVPTTKDDVTTWLLTDNVNDSAAGFSNTIANCAAVNSITFNTAGSTVNSTSGLSVGSGGILVTSPATSAKILGGTLTSGIADVIVHQYAAGDFQIGASIRGTNAITKTGPGALLLSGTNTATGTVNITDGLVKVSGGKAIGDAAAVNFKDAAGVGLQLLSSETIGSIAGGGLSGGNIALGSNTLTVNQSAALVFNGLLTGNGAFVKQGAANLNFDTSSSTGFNGSVVINQGLLFLSGNGLANLPAVTSITTNQGGAFLLDFNSGTTLSSRINDAAAINLSSSGNGSFFGLHIRNSQAANHTETFGALNLSGGRSVIGLVQTSGGTNSVTLTASSLNRFNNATVFVDGTNLSFTTGNNRTKFTVTTAPAMVGGTGVAGAATPATNVPIIRYAVALQNPSAIAQTDVPNTFLSYTAAGGMVPLLVGTEYKLNAGGYAASADVNDNLRFTTDAGALATKTFNAIVFDSTTAPMTISGAGGGTNVLTVNSGAMLFTSTASANGTTLNGFDAITPGAGSGNEFIVTVANNTTSINSMLTDGAAATTLTKSGSGTLVLGGANSYTGPTYFNQGIVNASNQNNLGSGGALNFFGGALQFGGVFDPSTRTINISALGGGATFDTNGNDITLANSIGNGGLGSLAKTGLGNLTLNAAATYTGGTTVTNGTLTAGAANVLPAGGALTVNGATAAVDLGANNQTVGTVTLTNGAINGSATLAASDYLIQGGTIASTVVLGGTGGVTKTTTSNVALGGSNTFSGQLAVQAGTVTFDSIANADGTPSALGAPATVANGTVLMGLGTAAVGLTYTGAGSSSDRPIDLVGTTGAVTVNASGSGALVLNGPVTSEEFGAKTLIFGGTSVPSVANAINGVISECAGTLAILKTDPGTWQFGAAETYTGATSINDGILRFMVDETLAGALNFGSANTITTAGTLDLTSANATFSGAMLVQTNSPSNVNHLIIGPGKTLTNTGNVTIGGNGANSTTLFDATGGGAWVVNNPATNGLFAVGGNIATGNRASADLSGISSLNVSLNTASGIFRVNPNNGTNVSDKYSDLTLPANTTITAATLAVGDSSQNNGAAGQVNTLRLGSATNIIHVNKINVGTGSGNRDMGSVSFATTTGTIEIRDAAGTGRATLNIGASDGTAVSTGVGGDGNTFDLSGHDADVLVGAVSIGTQNRAAPLTNTFNFNQGTLDMTSLAMSTRTAESANGAGNARTTTSTMNLGGGTVVIQNGILNMASAAGTYGTNPAPIMSAIINISGGSVTVGATSGTAVTMAAYTATGGTGTGSSSATINMTGGTTTINGNIVKSTASATNATATINIDGGTLDMAANNIGSSTAVVTLVAASGKLKNLGELNGGGLLTKTTTGTLTLEGVNTYTGNTLVSAGTLVVNNASGSGTGSGAVDVSIGATLAGNGVISPAAGKNITLDGTTVVGTPGSSIAEDLAMTIAGAGSLAFNGTIRFDIFANAETGAVNPATANDLLFVSAPTWSSLAFGPGSILKVDTSLLPTTWVQGDAWKIFDWTAIVGGTPPVVGSGGFATLDLPTLDGVHSWNTSQLYTAGVISIDVVPEPGRAMLLLAGLALACFRRRRSQRAII